MPGHATHLQVAGRVLRAWRNPPFDPRDNVCRAAFLAGANAPDMGYYPGGDKFLSDLAHYVRTGEVVRALARHAKSGPERAFAHGWGAHVLADLAVHPLINRAAGELFGPPGCRGLSYDDDPAAHLRVEMGLDGCMLVDGEWDVTGAGRCGLTAGVLRCLREAYHDTFGLAVGGLRAAWTFRGPVRFGGWMLAYGRVNGARLLGGPTPPHLVPLQLAIGAARRVTTRFRGSVVCALANPLRPPAWLVDEVGRAIDDMSAAFLKHAACGFANLPDANLDTGLADGTGPPYPPAERTHARLRAIVG